ncbi:MAG: amidohydrolase family protein [Candidatus Omnitrophica bacterium]|nr:amidohydrolase family protein [Candidatus Omnitrophota bacterium]
MIIDIHTHAWPEKVSQKARENLEQVFRVKLVGDPTLKTLLTCMDKNNIDISAVCGVATKPEQVPSINKWLFSVRSKRIKVFCALHPEYEDWKEELKKIRDNGDGIKLQPEFQDFYVDDEKVFFWYEDIEKLKLPLMFHCGKELSGTMLVRSSPDRMAKIMQKFPKLKIIAAHFGGFELWDEVKKHLLGKDIYLDTSFFFHFLPKEEIKSMILSHPKDRLLFGTDFPIVDQKKDIDFLNDFDIPQDLKNRIFSLNAKNILSL